MARRGQRRFFVSFLEGCPEFSRVSGDLFVLRENGRFYDLFVDVGFGGEVEFFGGVDGVWLDSVVVPGWVRRGLELS